ncbi:MAG: HEAT repeat domain-containing protein [Planctomycetes bacterium]|nr:HEAT repeat domain-containing protein [Planctomycetota bacterium]
MRHLRPLLLVPLLSPLFAQDATPATVERDDALAHYARVERELRDAPLPEEPAIAARRLAVIDALRDYRLAGVLGVNADFPGQRQPYFVDRGGRRCAVAYLLDRTGRGDVTLRVAELANHAWVADLADDPALQTWLEDHGLTLAEAARIQVPGSRGWGPPDQPPPPPREKPTPPKYDGPPDAGRPSPSPSGAGAPRPSGPAAAPMGGVPATAGAAAVGPQPRGVPVVQLDADQWLPWFDLQSSRWLGPRSLPPRPTTTSSDALLAQATAAARSAAEDEHAAVRAAAAMALGRLGVDEPLSKLTEDAAYEVRVAAVAGLGHVGNARAVYALLGLARQDDPLQPFALAALGAAGRRDAAVERVVEEILAASKDPALLAGAAANARLLGGDGVPSAIERSRGDDNSVVRSLVSAALGAAADAPSIAALTHAMSSRGLDVRRSAAVALGQSRDALALPALMTAYELERDVGTRLRLLLAIGEHGGAAARAFLVEQMQDGKKSLRAWAAIGLGLWGRGRDDAALGKLVEQASRSEHNHDLHGLWLVARGLLQDAASRDTLLDVSRTGEDSATRAGAVYGLGLLGDVTTIPSLVESLRDDHCPYVRGAVANVLASAFGDAATAALAEQATAEQDTTVRGAITFALGATGDPAAGAELLKLARSKDTSVRANAIRALGRLCDVDRARSYGRLAWGATPSDLPVTFAYLAQIDR